MDVLYELVAKFAIVTFPFILDENEIQESDIALVEGCVLDTTHVETLKVIRERCKKVFALGTCAAFGGIASLSEKSLARPVTAVIDVDGLIPGCPPPAALLNDAAIRIMDGKRVVLPECNVCASCELRVENMDLLAAPITSLTPDPSRMGPDGVPERCFLHDGVLCMGPVTRDGCGAKCMKRGIPCEGCMGPVSQDFTANAVNFMSNIPAQPDIKAYKGMLFRFSRPAIKTKPFVTSRRAEP